MAENVPAETPAESHAPVVMTNSTQVQIGPYGLVFLFQVRRHNGHVRDAAEVHMSLEHAKVISAILNRHIENYESQHGAIPVPEAIMKAAKDPPKAAAASGGEE